ncbi:MAG: Ig-like domain-containing protein [Muribaculaceae bacterium]|nr:Ig-like domain-containing protein [Roseburia sp.]MCM1431810.1 Ig-like domain-containing protein [Muribaculaceae bacterium]MCM1493491.1 Ig-like domain-containing protein [Muribaculaceae bacterium]
MRKPRIRNIRKCLAAALAASLVLALCPGTAQAMDFVLDSDGNYVTEEDAQGFYYLATGAQKKEKKCKVYVYGGKSSDVVLPKTCGSYKVTGVEKSFSSMIPFLGNMASLTTVKIPSGYKSIESGDGGKSGAFQNQTALYRIEIPESVTKIGENAFDGCDFDRLTFVTPYGSAAETYAKAHGIHYTNSKSLKVVPGATTMYAGESKKIAVYNCGDDIRWKSSRPSVASVDPVGCVTANQAGTAKITATIGSKNYSYTFKVLKRTEENVLKVIKKNYVTAGMSDYEKAVAALAWMEENVKKDGYADTAKAAFELKSASATGYAKAYQKILSGYGLSVKVVAEGDTMTNTVKLGSKSYKLSGLTSVKAADQTVTTTNVGSVVLKKNMLTLKVGKTGSFGANKSGLTWSSSNSKVATVDKSGKVTAKGAGTATITMKMGKKSYACTVRVKK